MPNPVEQAAVVDAHVHFLPEALAAAIRTYFVRHISNQIDYPFEAVAARERLLAEGVARCWALPYVRKPGSARELNRWMAETFADDDHVEAGATVHPGDHVRTVLNEAFASLGLRLCKIHCSVGGFAADDEALDPLWRACSDRGVPVVVHAGHATDGTTAASEIEPIARVARRWKEARIIVAHLGAPAVPETLALMHECDNVYGDLAPVVTTLTPLRRADIEGLEGRILFGSDMPNVAVSVRSGIEAVRSLGLAVADETAILGGNADRLIAGF